MANTRTTLATIVPTTRARSGRTLKAVTAAASVACIGGAPTANADITVTLTNQTFTGFNFSQFVDYTQYNIVGTLTGASINVTLNASVAYTYADDLSVYVDIEPLGTGGFLQIGGFSNLSAAQRYTWPNGASNAPGTTSIGTVTLTTALNFTANKAVDGTVWIGNGYGAAGTSGTWTGTVTLHGVDALSTSPPPPPPPVPQPGSWSVVVSGLLALLARSGMARAGRSRRT